MQNPDCSTRIFIVDDHQMVIDGLQSLLQNIQTIYIVGFTNNPLEVLDSLAIIPTDILITDINMPQLNGIALTKLVKARFKDIKIICLSMYSDDISVREMIDAGVNGYIFKNTGKQELLDAIETVGRGEAYFSAEISNAVLTNDPQNTPERLTQREIGVLKLIEMEMNNKQIAEQLFISERTVETHRKNIFRKTDTQNVIGLLKYAYSRHLI
ncbi:MAG: DNA-binding response regulator [Sphingobacteriales bacterium]|nr:MAG: DNA-binding response regulator [Sphingobacteriales bacterium]